MVSNNVDRKDIIKIKRERFISRRRVRLYERKMLEKMQRDHFLEFREWLPLDKF